MYYYEEQKLGKWRPRTKPERPSERGPEGEKLVLRAVTLIEESHRHLTLDQLFQVYSPEGTLQATGKTSSAPPQIDEDRLPPSFSSFQARVWSWIVTCFGNDVAFNKEERSDRFLEEVFELLQSGGYDPSRVDALKAYVWSRPVGEPKQEAGGVMLTLSALLSASEINMRDASETELERVWSKIEKIRAKQAAKPVGSALPQHCPPDPRDEAIAECKRMLESDPQSRMFGIDREMLELLVSR